MAKKLMIVLALLVAVSCVPVQAAESKSTWVIVKNSAKILIGAWLTVSGIRGVVGAVVIGANKEELQAGVEQALQEAREEARAKGVNMDEFEARANIGKGMANAMPAIVGVMGAGFTAGGIALIYSGYKGLTEEEESVKV